MGEEPNIQIRLKKKETATICNNIFAIQFFFSTVLGQKIYIPRPKKNKKIPEILTINEIKRMINSTNNIKQMLILKIFYGCGLRVGEVVNLSKNDVNFEEGLIHVRLSKGKKDRFVRMPASVKEELESYTKLNKEAALFPSNRGGKLTTATLQAIVENSARKANIKKKYICIC